MADFTLKQNDTWPPIDATLTDANGAINLTTATGVKFLMRPTAGGVATISAACSVLSAAAGTVRYVWVTGDTATTGTYQGEFEITWSDGKIGTVPNDGYISIEILDDVG